MGKYEYLTSEDLGYKPGALEQAKLEYSLLDKVFNKELDEKTKREGLLKRLKTIEGKGEEQLKAIKAQGEKQLQLLTSKADKKIDFKNVSLKGRLDCESKESIVKLKNKIKRLIIQNLSHLLRYVT